MNLFSKDANGRPSYESMFHEGQMHTVGTPVYADSPSPHETGHAGIAPNKTVASIKSAIDYDNDPTAYHEDKDDPAGSAIKYIVGEPTEEDYDKATRNAQRIGIVADALRHIGNIVNTSNYAPAQKIESTYDYLDKRDRQKYALRAKTRALEADEAYKKYMLGIQKAKAGRQAQLDVFNQRDKDRNYELRRQKNQREADLYPSQEAYWKAMADKASLEAGNKPTEIRLSNQLTTAKTNKTTSDMNNNTRRTDAYVAKMNRTPASGRGGKGGRRRTTSSRRTPKVKPSIYKPNPKSRRKGRKGKLY